MSYDSAYVAGKLRRWETYMNEFRLPKWEDIPNFGLYMEQVLVLLKEYLSNTANNSFFSFSLID